MVISKSVPIVVIHLHMPEIIINPLFFVAVFNLLYKRDKPLAISITAVQLTKLSIFKPSFRRPLKIRVDNMDFTVYFLRQDSINRISTMLY